MTLPPLDVPTLLQMIAVASVTMAASLAVVVRPGQREGMGWWACGLLFYACSHLLPLLRGQMPDVPRLVLAYVALSAMAACVQAGVDQFHGRALRWPLLLAPLLLMATLIAAFSTSLPGRLMVASAVLSVQLGGVLWSLWRPQAPEQLRGAALLTLALTLQLTLLLLRLAWLLQRPAVLESNSQLLASGVTQTTTHFSAFIVMLLASLGFILMSKDRADAANRRLAITDALTGVANRRSLIMALDRDLARAQRAREPLSLLMLDIDHFKLINDGHGHLAGDEVLRHMVQTVQQRLRAQDIIGRYGGEEFLVILPRTDLDGALKLAEQLRHGIEQAPCPWQGEALPVTISIGVWGGLVGRGHRWDVLVDAADRALYQAKRNGRNRVEVMVHLRSLAVAPSPMDDPLTFPASLR